MDWCYALNLRDAILDMVGAENAPCKYHRVSKPNDTIMCSTNVNVRKTGYLPFGDGVGDHYPLLIDIDKISVFGANGAPSAKLKARRLKLNVPRIIIKYTSLLGKFYVKHRLYWKVSQLNEIPIKYTVKQSAAEKYEEIDIIWI